MCQPRTNLALLNTTLLRNNGFFITKNKKLYCSYFAPLAQCQFGAGSSPSICFKNCKVSAGSSPSLFCRNL